MTGDRDCPLPRMGPSLGMGQISTTMPCLYYFNDIMVFIIHLDVFILGTSLLVNYFAMLHDQPHGEQQLLFRLFIQFHLEVVILVTEVC